MTPLIRPDSFPAVVDASIRATARACHRQAYWQYFRHQRLRQTGIDLHAGAAFAAGLDRARRAFYVEGKSEARAIHEGVLGVIKHWGAFDEYEEHVKSFSRVCGAILDYFCEYPLPTDFLKPLVIGGHHFIETSFAVPIPNTVHPETGDPVLYAGRFDLVAEYEGGIFIDDEKTTKQLGASWLNKWDLRGQFFGYAWGSRQYNIPVSGVITRGIAFLSKQYTHAQVPVHIADWQVEQYIEQVSFDVNELIRAYKENRWWQSFDDSCTNYGGCPYARLCTKLEPEAWLPIDYEEFKWNPLKRVAQSGDLV
jgi:hypothetical protein